MAGENVAATNSVGYTGMSPWMMSNYANQVMMNDLFDTMGYGGFGMTDPMMSMNGSLFPYWGGTNTDAWMENMDKWQDYSIDRRIRYQEQTRNADLRLNSPMEGIHEAGAALKEKIHKDEQEQILQALEHYKEAVKAAFPAGTDADIANRARSMYKQMFGVDMVDDIRENGKDSFTQGFIQALTFGLADNKTAEENIADITHQPVGRGDQTKKILGRASGGAVIGGTGAYLLSLSKHFKFLGKSKPLIIAGIGAVLAGLSALAGGVKSDTVVEQQS